VVKKPKILRETAARHRLWILLALLALLILLGALAR
jgi:hypothetical protein